MGPQAADDDGIGSKGLSPVWEHGPYDAVVDCAGLGAGALLGDKKVRAERGVPRISIPAEAGTFEIHDIGDK